MKGVMSDEEFLLVVKQMKGNVEEKSTAAARLVMVHGMTQRAAYLQTGSSASNVCGSVKRIRERHEEIISVYHARFTGKLGK